MEILTGRQKSILLALIPEYITRAVPIGSEFLVNEYGFGVRPATIRKELWNLTELGYLEQPHTSAGRVPSDKGYRFYVDAIAQKRIAKLDKSESRHKENFFRKIDEARSKDEFWHSLAKILDQFSDILVWQADETYDSIVFEGLRKTLRQPEFRDKESIDRFLDAFEKIRGEAKNIAGYARKTGEKVFIGEECGLLPSAEYSIIISQFEPHESELFWVAFFGPRRMKYKEHLELFDWMEEYLEI